MDETSPRAPAPYRYLGSLRALLASLVMLQHAGTLLPAWADAALQPLEVGGIAVFCFFIVSGFVIAEAVDAFYIGRPFAFLANRLLRLVPTYVAALVLTVVVLALAFPSLVPALNETPITPERFAPRVAVLNLLALFPIWKLVETHLHVPEILEQGWALRIEFLFYLVMALGLLVAAVTRVAMAAVLTALAIGLLIAVTLLPGLVEGSFLENTPYFVFGVAFYYALSRRRERLLPIAFCVSTWAFAAAHLLGRAVTFGPAHVARDRLAELAILAGLAMLFVGLAAIPEGRGGWAKRLVGLDRVCGELTYPLYLVHWCILVAAKAWLPQGQWASIVLAFAAALAVSALTVIMVERPMGRIRGWVRRRRSPAERTVGVSPYPAAP